MARKKSLREMVERQIQDYFCFQIEWRSTTVEQIFREPKRRVKLKYWVIYAPPHYWDSLWKWCLKNKIDMWMQEGFLYFARWEK